MPSHALPRPLLISRPGTVITLGLVVSSLSVAALIQSPGQAMAAGPANTSTTVTPVTEQGANATLSLVDLGRSRLARFVEQRAASEAGRKRAKARERRQRLQARQRRDAARAATRAERSAPQWVMPVSGAGMSAFFGESGSAWSSGYHTGQDFTAPSGTPVHAVTDGTITSATWSDAYGNIIEITHPNGDQSWYAHMSSFEQTSGAVSADDVIGYVGCTGNCFGNHVHFEYHPGGGEATDPMPWLRNNGAY